MFYNSNFPPLARLVSKVIFNFFDEKKKKKKKSVKKNIYNLKKNNDFIFPFRGGLWGKSSYKTLPPSPRHKNLYIFFNTNDFFFFLFIKKIIKVLRINLLYKNGVEGGEE